ncbi:M23 family metallopeptidase [Propionivibrio dicarboxylicus]|uniref:Murein DD-endopeptidase MepM and murein hydrolase activator NlpD, contain LysM domain n=1 Tax=Propionivibrio dicarboxylicus TaxID=83767 RepID=A0A1G8K8T5_9RHOO|nr:M23 family metallopeptidase [Propionivibrio dicarboxylicus]SDI39769.1 Murein DD-endopeptidase MepM and murein hydrolase activator NlpD, contain LysM domain [Propionivibrio dicarboxylicus]
MSARKGFAGLLALMPMIALGLPLESRVPGGIALLPLGKVEVHHQAPRAWLDQQPVWVTRDRGEWIAVVGIALDTPTGPHTLRVSDGADEKSLSFEIQAKHYPEQHVTLKDMSKVRLSPEDETRALAEIARIKEIRQHWRPTPDADGHLTLPADGLFSGRFGNRRIFNGEPRAPHSGADIAIPRGTVVKAAAAGTVLAVDDYFFNGKTIFIDHGNGLITLVCHLDRIDVALGQSVSSGQEIGRSGMSGRASGPHLHWSVYLNGVAVDPALWVRPTKTGSSGKVKTPSTKRL